MPAELLHLKEGKHPKKFYITSPYYFQTPKLPFMLSSTKKAKLLNNLKIYSKKYLNKMTELDESGTRLMVNHFLTDVLGFIPIEEVKTEYMIRGTYADYVIQCRSEEHTSELQSQ